MRKTTLWKIVALLCLCALLTAFSTGCGKKDNSPATSQEPAPPTAQQPSDNTGTKDNTPYESGKITLSDGSVYPSEPITILCGWAPGGNSDLMCQLLASKLKESIGVNANVSYMEGGDGTIALGSIANNTEADGYTIALCASGQFSIKPFTQDVSYEIENFSFTPGAAEECYCIFVNKDTGFETLDDLVAYYKANPDKTLHYGMSGANGIPHLSTRLVWDELGLSNTQVVSYDGGATALAACLGSEIEAICVVASIGQPSYESGDLNAMVMLTNERLAAMPDVKTLGEFGYETISAGVKKAYCLPAGTDPQIVDFLSDIFQDIYSTDEWAQFLADNTCNPCTLTGEEYKDACMSSAGTFWNLLEQLDLLKEGAEKPAYMLS